MTRMTAVEELQERVATLAKQIERQHEHIEELSQAVNTARLTAARLSTLRLQYMKILNAAGAAADEHDEDTCSVEALCSECLAAGGE